MEIEEKNQRDIYTKQHWKLSDLDRQIIITYKIKNKIIFKNKTICDIYYSIKICKKDLYIAKSMEKRSDFSYCKEKICVRIDPCDS